jgi:hypothetical protein
VSGREDALLLVRIAVAGLAVAAALAATPLGVQAFGGAGETEMPAQYYCLDRVRGSYIIIAHALGSGGTAAGSGATTSALVSVNSAGCDDDAAAVEEVSSAFYPGRVPEGSGQARLGIHAGPTTPMVAVDLQHYLRIYSTQGVEAADAWARSQYYR